MSDKSVIGAKNDNANDDENGVKKTDKKLTQRTLILLAIGFVLNTLLFAIITLFTRVGESASNLAVAGLAVRQVEPSNQVVIELATAIHLPYFPSLFGLWLFVGVSGFLWGTIIIKIIKSQH
jgi:4-hydroxybenzoate polyprenyltransferase